MIKFFRALILASAAALLLASCTTRPVLPGGISGPAALLPAEEDYYLLSRPAGHPDLTLEILGLIIEADRDSLASLMGRTEEAFFSGSFDFSSLKEERLPPLSGYIRGDFPAFFVRSSLRKDKGWEKSGRYVYAGPGGLETDTAYKDTLLLASGKGRLPFLREGMAGDFSRTNLTPELADWWRSGQPALIIYIPDLSGLPLPEGLPAVPASSSLEMAFITGPAVSPGAPDSSLYSLDLTLRLPDSRSARFWSMGLRFFLAARLGLSDSDEEKTALSLLSLSTSDTVIHLSGWTMSSGAWGSFMQSLRPQGENPGS